MEQEIRSSVITTSLLKKYKNKPIQSSVALRACFYRSTFAIGAAGRELQANPELSQAIKTSSRSPINQIVIINQFGTSH